jgi:RimJ/RimL family protein N-acetyltransferase
MIDASTVLEDELVRLRPLAREDADGLWAVGQERGIWSYMRAGVVDSPEKMVAWVEATLAARERMGDYPFVQIDKASGRVAGATRYMTVDAVNRSLEIGGTWLGVEFQRSGINTHAKYLLLQHAFEVLGCIRVQLRTDSRNVKSQRAIERIGAVKEGTFRKDFIYPDGYQRDTIFYSIVEPEWPAAKARLEAMLARRPSE